MNVGNMIEKNKLDDLENYLKAGGRTDVTNEEGLPPLISAVSHQNMEALMLLLSYNADVNANVNVKENNITALILTVSKGHIKFVHTLLINGANPNIIMTSNRYSLLHLAVMRNRPDFIPLLLLYGTDAELKSKNNKTPLGLAISLSRSTCAWMLSKNKQEVNNKAPLVIKTAENTEEIENRKRKAEEEEEEEKEEEEEGGDKKQDDLNIKKQKLTHEINELRSEKTSVLLSLEKRNVKDIAVEMSQTKENIAKSHKLLKDQQQTLLNLRMKLKELTESIIIHDQKILILEKNSSIAVGDCDIVTDLECPICFEVPYPPILVYQCDEGHIYCSKCKEKISLCPQCRKPIKGMNIRCRVMEKLIVKSFLS